MGWAKLDDRFHENRKIRGVWRTQPAALGLHVMALTYCAGHETDGFVDVEFVVDKVPAAATRKRLIAALETAGMWSTTDGGWKLHDYLEFHPSRASLEEKRAKDADRKARGRAHGAHAPSNGTPRGHAADTPWTPQVVPSESNGPVPTRPDPTRTQTSSATPTPPDETNAGPRRTA